MDMLIMNLNELPQGGGIVEKAFALPLVNATYDSLASLSTPLQVSSLKLWQLMTNCLLLQPYAEKGAAMMSSMGESYGAIKAGVQEKVEFLSLC